MDESITSTINQSERAELEALLDLWRKEFPRDQEEHERITARIERHLSASQQYLDLIRANLDKPCGKL